MCSINLATPFVFSGIAKEQESALLSYVQNLVGPAGCSSLNLRCVLITEDPFSDSWLNIETETARNVFIERKYSELVHQKCSPWKSNFEGVTRQKYNNL
jgi:hypothetical protein